MGALPIPPPLPPYRDQLSTLFANLANPNATTAPAPGVSAPAPAPPPVAAAPAPPIQQAPAAPVAAPSDDPAITSGRQNLDQSSAALQDAIKTYQGTQAKIAAVPPVDYNAKKPSPWSRLLGGIVGTAAGYGGGPQVAQQVARGVTYRTLNQADIERQRQLDPLFQQLQSEREGIPMYQAANEGAWRQFQGGLDASRENRLKQADDNTIGSKLPTKEIGPDGQAHYYQITKGGQKVEVETPKSVLDDQRKRDEDSNTPATGARPEPDPTSKGAYRIKTKSGDYIPYTFKSVDEAALAGDKTGTALFNREHQPRETDKEKRGTPNQFAGVEVKKQQALTSAEHAYKKALTDLAPNDADGQKEALDELNGAKQRAQDAYEQELQSLGGTASHVDATTAGKPGGKSTAPPNAATPPPTLWQGKETKILSLRDPATKQVHRWQLKGGAPQMID